MPHVTANKSIAGFRYCARCGLMYLKNEWSQAAYKYGCNYDEHPEYKRVEQKVRKQQRERLS
jgi:hypothetical protein